MNYIGQKFIALDNRYTRQYKIVGKIGIVTNQWKGLIIGHEIIQSNINIKNISSNNKANFTLDEIQFINKKIDYYLPDWF